MNLQLSLKKEWFEMTKAGVKSEDYREITPYWVNRFFIVKGDQESNTEIAEAMKNFKDLNWLNQFLKSEIKKFDYNIMTLGYPLKTDTARILKFKHEGIEIRQGNPEWGAEPNKLYFVVKHGEVVG